MAHIPFCLGCIVFKVSHIMVACSASDRQGSNFESCVWRTVSSQSFHHPQEVLLAQFSLYVHKSGLKPIHFISFCHLNHLTILQEVLLAQFSLYVHKGGLKPDSFHYLILCFINTTWAPITLTTLKYVLYKPWRPKGFFQFEIIINVFVSSFCFI